MVKYLPPYKGKIVEAVYCEACGAVHLDDEGGCPNYCLECEACKRMTKLQDLDPTLLIEAQAEICHDCADEFLEEISNYKSKYPKREDLGLTEFGEAETDELYLSTGMVMGDHKGRT